MFSLSQNKNNGNQLRNYRSGARRSRRIEALVIRFPRHILSSARSDQMNSASQSVTEHQRHHDQIATDVLLVERFQDGCTECFALLFHHYCKMVFAIAWKILRRKSDAEDIVQEVFLSIFLQRNRYDASRGSVSTWIGQFAHFKAMSRRRYLYTRGAVPIDEDTAFELGVTQANQAHNMMERAALVKECLASLNTRQRRSIEAVHFDGYTLRETADLLHESLANTRNLYYRGMKCLRSHLQGLEPSEDRDQTAQDTQDLSPRRDPILLEAKI
jgi:RNA polymerase sigma-70 factor, ECF subfamily